MKLHDGIRKAYDRQWSFSNTFSVMFTFIKNDANKYYAVTDLDPQELNLNIISFTSPAFTNTPQDVWIGNKWKTYNIRDQVYRFTIKFRDHSNLKIYRAFLELYLESKEQYFNNVKFDVKVNKEADHFDEKDKLLYHFSEVIVEQISDVAFNNEDQNKIVEFDVTFKAVDVQLFNKISTI